MALSDFGRVQYVDPQIVQEISTDPKMSAEQGVGFMSDWGGPTQYVEMSQWPTEARMVYFAVQKGFGTVDEIASAIGLSRGEVDKGIGYLEGRGIVTSGAVTK